jgi:hypothetical protein
MYACAYWVGKICATRATKCVSDLLQINQSVVNTAIEKVEVGHILSTLRMQVEFEPWVGCILTNLQQTAQRLLNHVFFHGNHVPVDTKTAQPPVKPIVSPNMCTLPMAVHELACRSRDVYHFPDQVMDIQGLDTGSKRVIAEFAANYTRDSKVPHHIPTAIKECQDCLFRYPTIVFPSGNTKNGCPSLDFLAGHVNSGPTVVVCQSHDRARALAGYYPRFKFVTPGMPHYDLYTQHVSRAYCRSAGIVPVAGNGVVKFPTPSLAYVGDQAALDRHLHGLQRSSPPTDLFLNGKKVGYIFTDCRQRTHLIAHSNYMNIINRKVDYTMNSNHPSPYGDW